VEEALYRRDGDGFVGTTLTQGAWDREAQNGAAVLSLLGHCLEDVPSLAPMSLSRFTVDLVRPVPIGVRLDVVPSVIREGKKIQVVELQLMVGDVTHVRATALRVRDADVRGARGLPDPTPEREPIDRIVAPEQSGEMGRGKDSPGFLQGIEMRRAPAIEGPGMGYWVRLAKPVVAGEPIRATSRLTLGFDFASLIGVDLTDISVSLINPDVTAHVLRPPTGEWVSITGQTRFRYDAGRGVSVATISDFDGPFAFASASQIIQPAS